MNTNEEAVALAVNRLAEQGVKVTTQWVDGHLCVDVHDSPDPGPSTWWTVWRAFYPVVGIHRVEQH